VEKAFSTAKLGHVWLETSANPESELEFHREGVSADAYFSEILFFSNSRWFSTDFHASRCGRFFQGEKKTQRTPQTMPIGLQEQ
jgi:hypothetical protein